MEWLHQLYIFLTALFMALIMVPALRRWAIEKKQFEIPRGLSVPTGENGQSLWLV